MKRKLIQKTFWISANKNWSINNVKNCEPGPWVWNEECIWSWCWTRHRVVSLLGPLSRAQNPCWSLNL